VLSFEGVSPSIARDSGLSYATVMRSVSGKSNLIHKHVFFPIALLVIERLQWLLNLHFRIVFNGTITLECHALKPFVKCTSKTKAVALTWPH
jgi:hypothetical protein